MISLTYISPECTCFSKELSHYGENALIHISLFYFRFHPGCSTIKIISIFLWHIYCSCTNLWTVASHRLRGHLAAVDRREQLLTGPCRGGVSQSLRPKRLWHLIHCSSGPHSPHPACYCHRDQYALG